jgi:TfoX/Sxy family transcriptional regulator of competence genes
MLGDVDVQTVEKVTAFPTLKKKNTSALKPYSIPIHVLSQSHSLTSFINKSKSRPIPNVRKR